MKTLLLLMTLTTVFDRYDATRLALVKGNLKEAQTHATALAAAAKDDAKIAARAKDVAGSKDLAKARDAFGALSDEMIRIRTASGAPKRAVYYCSMLKKSWLQKKGEVGNPYAAGMEKCGELKAE